MDDRKLYILSAVIHSYISSAEPIGSRTLQRKYNLKVSPATIRNDMSDLEQSGYLRKAHTSSGRIPSNRAYRWYVDSLLEKGQLVDAIPALMDFSLLHKSSELEYLIEHATKILSEISDYTAFGLVPELNEDVLRHIELLMLDERDLVLIYVYQSKAVKNNVIRLKQPTTKKKVDYVNKILKDVLLDQTTGEISSLIEEGALSNFPSVDSLLEEIVPMIRTTNAEASNVKVFVEGLDKMLVYPEYERDKAKKLMEFLQSDKASNLLNSESDKPVEVFIGGENEEELLRENSIVVGSYELPGKMRGKIGLIGPTRMHYNKAIHDVSLMAAYIDSIVNRK